MLDAPLVSIGVLREAVPRSTDQCDIRRQQISSLGRRVRYESGLNFSKFFHRLQNPGW
jgi:hypothetical protein